MNDERDDGGELAALAREIAEVEGLSPEDALDRALRLLPWLAPYAERWACGVLAGATGVAQPITLAELAS